MCPNKNTEQLSTWGSDPQVSLEKMCIARYMGILERMKQILPILADIANGIFATVLAGLFTNTEILWWYFLIGIPLAMLPDLDAIPELLRRGKVASSSTNISDHRDGLHFPVLFLIIGICAGIYFGFFGYLFLFATMLHFVNDVYGTGWGIKLLWPISKRKYKFFGSRINQPQKMLKEKGAFKAVEPAEQKIHFLASWSEQEQPEYIKRFGYDDWIDRVYMTVNWISITEYCLFGLSLILLMLTLIY